MVLLNRGKSKSNVDIFFDPKLSRAVGPQFYLNGQQLPFYEWRGRHAPGHTPAVLKNSDGASREKLFAA